MDGKERYLSKSYWENRLRLCPYDIRYIPKELECYDMYLYAVKRCGLVLQYVPPQFRKYNMYSSAIINNVDALQYVPNHMKRRNWHLLEHLASSHMRKHCNGVKYLTNNFFANFPHHIYKNISENGTLLRDVPEKFRTLTLCNSAIKNDPKSFRYVPDEYKSQEMCDHIIKKSIGMFTCVPDRFKTAELCHIVEKKLGRKQFLKRYGCLGGLCDSSFNMLERMNLLSISL